jgi:hypothetical protein
MALSADLLAQARHLALNEPKRPKQASLRRAASSSYYALFHFLVDKAARTIVSGGGPDRQVLRQAVSRAFKHAQMLTISKAFGGKDKNAWKSLFPGTVPPDLIYVAQTFVELQLARHEADYDLTRDFTRAEVQVMIAQVQQAMQVWPNIADHPLTRAYLLGLVLSTRS